MGFIFNIKGPRKFNHQPIYYDQRKEELEKRVKKVEKEMGLSDDKEEYVPDIKGKIIGQTHHVKKRIDDPSKSGKRRNMIMGIALVVLLILFYYVYLA